MGLIQVYALHTLLASIPLQSHPVLSNGSLFFHLDDVDCVGNESMLSECNNKGVGLHNCDVRFESAGVICSSELLILNLIIIQSKVLL